MLGSRLYPVAREAIMEREALVRAWRERAERLEAYARTLRREHYLAEAEDTEQAALDYRIAADELEAQEAALARTAA